VLNTDHVVVIAGWGVDAATGMHYWVGRNSYGTQVTRAGFAQRIMSLALLASCCFYVDAAAAVVHE
jgi:hypothetical protein